MFYDIDAYYTHAGRTHREDDLERSKVGLIGELLLRIAWRGDRSAEPTPAWWKSIIPDNAGDALEIGSGDGDRMITYAPFVRHVRGVEPDPRAVSVARSRKLDVLDGTAENLPPEVKDRQYDLIVFSHVLEHTIDPVASLRNAGELLSDRGIMSIEVPNNACIGAVEMGGSWRWLDAPRHLNFFTPQSLQACAEAAGLKVEAVLYRGYVRQFLPEWMIDEARVRAIMERRYVMKKDVKQQVRHSIRLLAKTFFAAPEKKYDSVRILCRRA
ncbi:MAG: class I SAM-dependent methyltransferase [Paracoccaceae bacterium]